MSIKKCITLIATAILCNQISAYEYLYPVAGVKKNNERYLYLLYQKNTDHLELFLWHEKTKIISKVLSSNCMPAGLRLLPDQKGFSFIDNGRIKIKLFNKRSPKSVDFNNPIYQIELIEWIDAKNFYFCAKENGKFGIFQSNTDGAIHKIHTEKSADCIYPQKIENRLFYIERTHEAISNHSIKITTYPTIENNTLNFNATHDFDMRVEQLLQSKQNGHCHKNSTNIMNNDSKTIFDSGRRPIAFLRMVSKNEGYFVQYEQKAVEGNKNISFEYHQIKKNELGWKTTTLFSFEIPLLFLQDDSGSGYTYRSENSHRIHESILPLLPCHTDNGIYYVSASNDNQNHLCLHLYTKDSLQTTYTKNAFFSETFGLVKLDDTLFYGGALHNRYNNEHHDRFLCNTQIDNSLPLGMWINNHGHTCYDQPFLSCTP